MWLQRICCLDTNLQHTATLFRAMIWFKYFFFQYHFPVSIEGQYFTCFKTTSIWCCIISVKSWWYWWALDVLFQGLSQHDSEDVTRKQLSLKRNTLGSPQCLWIIRQCMKIIYTVTRHVLGQEYIGPIPQLKDGGCDNMLPDYGHRTP